MKKKNILFILIAVLLFNLMACNNVKDSSKIIIYSNADEEAVTAMEKALDNNGYKDKYIMKTFGTSELGGKLLAEGKNIEADMLTMSSFYVDSAQEKSKLFLEFTPNVKLINKDNPNYSYPITVQEGAIFFNTKEMEADGLKTPKNFKDLTDSTYKGKISISDVTHSSTAWLTIQALVDNYGENEAKNILKEIYANAGDNIESSGSGPMKKAEVGEVAIGIGLRHQAVLKKQEGKPIDFVDPEEGTYYLTENLAIVNKGNGEKEATCKKMADIILTEARKDIIKLYPNAVYEGEVEDEAIKAKNVKKYPKKLTVELLDKHKKLSEEAKNN